MKTKKRSLRWFLLGFGTILVIFVVFASGYLFGSGRWSIDYKIKTIKENNSLPDKLDYSAVNEVYQSLKRKYDGQLDKDKIILGLKKGLVEAAGDPYTTYMDVKDAKDFNEQLNGSFTGIGAELGKDGSNIIIISPISGFPADKAGLKPKDVIVSIDGQNTSGISVDEAVKRIRGEKGTTVKLVIVRNNEQRLDFSIVRDTITIPSVDYKIINDNIGYLKISRFAEDTVGLVNNAANDFSAKKVKGIIVDLRNNPGGYLNSAVDISGKWLKDDQVILKEKRGGKTIQTFTNDGTGRFNNIPTVVLINDGSASASEIMAGALKDNKAATVLGVKSFGKGSVQEFSSFTNGDMLKVTIARWFTPNGKNIDKEGITPNKKVEISEADVKAKKDPQLDAAVILLKK
jgi:carboxyl-terminal processing protease